MLSTCFPLFPKLLASLPSTTEACAHAVHGFWPVEELVELANGPGEGWVFIYLELSVIRSTVLRKAERREGLDQT